MPRSVRSTETLRDARDMRRTAHNPEVAGSNPAPATKLVQVRGPIAGDGQASDLHGSVVAAGRGRTGRTRTRETGSDQHRGAANHVRGYETSGWLAVAGGVLVVSQRTSR